MRKNYLGRRSRLKKTVEPEPPKKTLEPEPPEKKMRSQSRSLLEKKRGAEPEPIEKKNEEPSRSRKKIYRLPSPARQL